MEATPGLPESIAKSEFLKIRGIFFGGPYNKDYSILGSILGSHNFGKLPNETAAGIC